MAAHRAKRGGVHGSVVSFLFSSQCIASASFVFMYIIFIHLALLYTEEVKGLSDHHASLSEVSLDLSGFLGSGTVNQGRKLHQVKSEELRAALGDLPGLHRKVKFSFPQWAHALRFSFDGAASTSPQHLIDEESTLDHEAEDLEVALFDKMSLQDHETHWEHGGNSEEEEDSSQRGIAGGLQEEGDDPPGEEGTSGEVQIEDIVDVEHIVEDLVEAQRGHAEEEITASEERQASLTACNVTI